MVYMRTDDILRSVVVLFLAPSSSFLSPVVGSKASATRGEERPFPPPPVIPRSSSPPCSTIRRLTSTSLLAQRRQVKSLVPRARVTVIPPFRYGVPPIQRSVTWDISRVVGLLWGLLGVLRGPLGASWGRWGPLWCRISPRPPWAREVCICSPFAAALGQGSVHSHSPLAGHVDLGSGLAK